MEDDVTLISTKETTRRRTNLTSSLNEISTDQQGNRVVSGGGGGGGNQPDPTPSGHIFKDDVNGFFLYLGYLFDAHLHANKGRLFVDTEVNFYAMSDN